MTTSTTPTNPDPSAKVPPAPAPSGPKSVTIPAGKTVVLVDTATNKVMVIKTVQIDTRIFTGWQANIYADMATATAAITTNKWIYVLGVQSTETQAQASSTPTK